MKNQYSQKLQKFFSFQKLTSIKNCFKIVFLWPKTVIVDIYETARI